MEKMANESTPLITTVVVGPPRRRYPHQTVRRFCTIALGSTLFAVLIFILVDVIFGPIDFHPGRGVFQDVSRGHQHLSYEELQGLLLSTPSGDKAAEWSQYYTSGPHLAGQNLSQAAWTQDKWTSWGVDSDIVAYDTYINYPVDHRLTLLQKPKSSSSDSETWSVVYKASLTEDVLEEDPTSALENRIPTFHGYSASGNVTGSYVYVNYGTYADFEELVAAGVSLEGKIALARYGGIFRGLKVKRAEELGMIGCVLYSDPGDDGEMTEENGYEAYPNGPARNPSSVQRGSVQFLSIAPGDPTTVGYPSLPGAERQPVEGKIPSIPSLPISYQDAIPILKALNGHGPSAEDLGEDWTKSIGLKHKGVKYDIGPTPDDLVLNLYNEQDYSITPMWDVIGIVNGTISDEVIVIGNHRDAWVAGGAGDPNSGSAVLNEVVRSFGQALEKGWKPLRTLVFASWDGEEYGLVGSTEWVEEYLPWLDAANVAYLNLDVACTGPNFKASAAPLMHKLLHDVTAMVPSPNQTVKGQTVGDIWDGYISTMGSGSDFTAFQDFAGIPSLDMGFTGETEGAPVYQYHSNYDSFHWMSEFGDPGFAYHKTMAQILGLAIAKISETPLIALNATDYASALDDYVSKVESDFTAVVAATTTTTTTSEDQVVEAEEMHAFGLSLNALHKSVGDMRKAAVALDAKSAKLSEKANENIPWWKWWAKLKLLHQIRSTNNKYKRIERAFLYEYGLDGRDWFKHVVFAPGLWTGYAGAVFPGLVESLDDKDFINGLRWVEIIDDCIQAATKTMM